MVWSSAKLHQAEPMWGYSWLPLNPAPGLLASGGVCTHMCLCPFTYTWSKLFFFKKKNIRLIEVTMFKQSGLLSLLHSITSYSNIFMQNTVGIVVYTVISMLLYLFWVTLVLCIRNFWKESKMETFSFWPDYFKPLCEKQGCYYITNSIRVVAEETPEAENTRWI